MVDSSSNSLANELQSLWQVLAANAANRALTFATILGHHGDEALNQFYSERIRQETGHSPQRDEALRLLVRPALLAAPLSMVPSPAPVEPIRVEPELGRLAIGLSLAALFRVWCIGRELTRSEGGSGQLDTRTLYAALGRYGVEMTADHFSRLLREGSGLFWNTDVAQRLVYLRSPAFVAGCLVKRAAAEKPSLIASNPPGVRDMYVSPSGSLEGWESALYAAWMAFRENPTISRVVLTTLFNRSGDTLRRWEGDRLSATLTVRTNYAQCPVEPGYWPDTIPEHALPYLANVREGQRWKQEQRFYWRIPNTYLVTGIRQHPKRGQAFKVRQAVLTTLDQIGGLPRSGKPDQPAFHLGQAPERRYFEDPKKLKRYVQKHGCSERLLWRGENVRGYGMFEPTLSYGMTHANERASYKQEYRYFKQQAEQQAAARSEKERVA